MWYRHPMICLLVAFGSIFLALIVVMGAVSVVSVVVFNDWNYIGSNEIYQVVLTGVSAYIGYIIYVKSYEKRPVIELALASKDGKGLIKYFGKESAFLETIYGLLLGTVLISFLVVIMILSGLYRVDFKVVSISTENLLSLIVTIGFGAAFIEELIFRGIIFRLVEKWLGSWIAIVSSGLLFGFAHAANPNSTIFSSLAIGIEAGLLLAAVYMITRRLWMVIGLHFAWNVVQGLVFSVPVSGIKMDGLIDVYLVSGKNKLLTGGAFGLEASIITVILMTVFSVFLLIRISHTRGIFPNPILRKLVYKLQKNN